LTTPRITLLGRGGCHLCESAREVVAQVAGEAQTTWQEIDVDTDPDLRAEWGDLVPVTLVDGVCIGYYEIEPAALRSALA
jgi:hypothetical protein